MASYRQMYDRLRYGWILLVVLVSFSCLLCVSIANGHAILEKPPSLKSGTRLSDDSPHEASANLPDGTSSDWWSTVQQNIRDSEYHVTWQEKTHLPDGMAAWQAPNRAQNLRTYFTADGVHIVPRTSDHPEWFWGLSLQGYGVEGDVKEVSPPMLTVSKNRIKYQRGAGLTEWYLNDPRGLEQGFTLTVPPAGFDPAAGKSWIALEMAVQGDLQASYGDHWRTK